MKLAIHDRKGSFSDGWIKYCDENDISYKIVNCYDNDIIQQVSDCDGLMWHWDLTDYKTALFARQLTLSLEMRGLKVFPNSNTSWHYDDKLGQKYLFEAIGAPLVPTNVFYTKKEALEWIKSANFPLVFKLRGGASAINVKLVKSTSQARKLIKKAFGKGFPARDRMGKIKDKFLKFKRHPSFNNFSFLIKSILRIYLKTELEMFSPKQIGYIYFQDFIPQNDFDVRIEIVGNKCAATRRYNRPNDFRASGSGIWKMDKELFDTKMLKIAFDIVKKLELQSVAFDFINDEGSYKIIEMSYCWPIAGSELYPGYWDRDLNWYKKPVTSDIFIIEDFIEQIKN